MGSGIEGIKDCDYSPGSVVMEGERVGWGAAPQLGGAGLGKRRTQMGDTGRSAQPEGIWTQGRAIGPCGPFWDVFGRKKRGEHGQPPGWPRCEAESRRPCDLEGAAGLSRLPLCPDRARGLL